MEATHVARLSVRAESDAWVRRRVFLIEDALRTVQPRNWAPHGMCWIRRLDLGRAPPHISSIAFSSLVEERLNQMRPLIVGSAYIDDPNAEAVWFIDELAPWRMVLKRLVLELPLRAWYWVRAIEMTQSNGGVSLPMALLHSLGQGEPGKHAVAGLMSQAVQEHWIDPLLTHIAQGDVVALSPLLSADSRASIATSNAVPAMPRLRPLPAVWQSALSRWLLRWGREDPRSRWLARIALAASGVVYSPEQELAAADQLLRVPIAGAPATRASGSQVQPRPDAHERIVRPESGTEKSRTSEPPSAAPTEPELAAMEVTSSPNDYSPYAGFAFILNVLQRVGLAETLVANPHLLEENMPSQLLDRLAQRARLPKENPARDWYAHLKHNNPSAERTVWAYPSRWTKLFPEVAFPPSAVDAFERAAILFLRRHARMTLRRLVKRNGELSRTPTHLDAVFGFDQLDIRIRRAGLDIDPGWISWLKRVVHFHYIEG